MERILEVAIITDQHFGVRNDAKQFLDHQAKFYNDVFFPTLLDRNITHILDLGDSFDRRKYINFNTLMEAKEMFYDKVKEYGMTMDIIAGNHTAYYKNTNRINTMDQLFSGVKHLNIYWNDAVEIELDGCKIMLCPWICAENEDRIKESIAKTDAQVLMGHFEIAGFEMHRGSMCEHGENVKTFDKFDIVMSGHFHHKSTHRNINYLGAPYEMTWSDYGDPKGFHIFDTSTRELTFIKNPYRMFHKIEYDDSDMTIEDVAELDTSLLTNTHIKVIVKSKSNPYIFDLFMDRLLQSGASDIKTIDDLANFELNEDDDGIDEAQDTLTILHNFLDSVEVKGDKKNVETFLNNLYNEAINL